MLDFIYSLAVLFLLELNQTLNLHFKYLNRIMKTKVFIL